MRLAANVIGAESLPAAVAAKVLATSEGNPLFVGELVRMLVHEGALKHEGDRWTTGTALAALEMPPTIHALLAARIERLDPEERRVLEHASIVGRQFSRSAVAELLPGSKADLDERLESLQRSELIERDSGWFFGEPVLRFHHVLIRDAAYRQLLKGSRAELHTRFADWAVARAEGSTEHDETIGWHFEQAHQFLRELGPIDAAGRVIGERASAHLGSAGRRALAGDDVSLAASLLGRSIERLDPDDEARAELALDWCEALLAAGDVGPALSAIDELDRHVGDSERLRAWHTCYSGQYTLLTAPDGLQSTAEIVAAAADTLTDLDDAAGEAKAHFVYALALSSLGKIGACEAALDQALAAARRVAGDRRRANTVLAIAPLAALWGPSPVTRASGRCLDVVRVLRITQGAPAVEAVALSCQGVLEALRGRTEAARRMIASARTMVEELGITQRLLEVDVFSGQIDLLEGDATASEASLRGAYDGLRDLGLGIDAARAAALLARALLAQNRVAEAETLSHESEALAGDDLKAAIAWRGVRAEALARRGEHAEAVAFASRAVELATATDALLDHADARLAFAAALRAAGREREANAEERRANELWEEKGATLLAERARNKDVSAASLANAGTAFALDSPIRRRRVRENAVTKSIARFEVKLAARDFRALPTFFDDAFEEEDHQIGATLSVKAVVASIERLLRDHDPQLQMEPIATLGDAHCLCLRRVSSSGTRGGRFDVGAYESEAIHLFEGNADGLWLGSEVFALDRINEGIARLYERYAESLPEGPDRDRAAAILRGVRAWTGSIDLIEHAATIEPAAQLIDHRVLSTWASRDAAELLEHMRLQVEELAPDFRPRVEDVIAIEPDAHLLRTTYEGNAIGSGGYFENRICLLYTFGVDGRIAHIECFEAEAEVDALARFEELRPSAQEKTPPHRRHVNPNTATAAAARFDAALAARDLELFETLLADNFQEISHRMGSEYERDGLLDSLRRMMRSHEPCAQRELLAGLGDHLCISRLRVAVSGSGDGQFNVGATEREEIALTETNEDGQIVLSELFASDRLAEATTRLYERYAERLTRDAGSERAARTARTVDSILGTPTLEVMNSIFAPSLKFVDRRTLGQGSVQGAPAMREWGRAMYQEEEAISIGLEDLLRIEPDAALVQTCTRGTARASGGRYERLMWAIWTFAHDGLVEHLEFFDVGSEANAIKRFEELTAIHAERLPLDRRISSNQATVFNERFAAATMRRDIDAIDALLAERFHHVHHPTGASFGRRGFMNTWRSLVAAEHVDRPIEMLGALGDRLAMGREFVTFAGLQDEAFEAFGKVEIHDIFVTQNDALGLCERIEIFSAENLGLAVARLYELYAAELPEGEERTAGMAIASALSAYLGAPDVDVFLSSISPTMEMVDHRPLRSPTIRGADGMRMFIRAIFEAETFRHRVNDVLRVESSALLLGMTAEGTAYPGTSDDDRRLLALALFGRDGLIIRFEVFDTERQVKAMGRFDALTSSRAMSSSFENAATRALDGFIAAWHAQDWPAVERQISPDVRQIDRRDLMHLELDGQQYLESLRFSFEMSASRLTADVLATRGDHLALLRFKQALSGDDVGESEIDYLCLSECEPVNGRQCLLIRWNLDDIDAAYAELDERFETSGAAARTKNWSSIRTFVNNIAARDWDAVAATCADDFVEYDHRSLAVLGTTHGGAAWARNFSMLAELAADTIYRIHHFVPGDHGYYVSGGWYGKQDGGDYEMPLGAVIELDDDGRYLSADIYDSNVEVALDQLAKQGAAKAFASPLENEATRAAAEKIDAWHERDWERFAGLFPDHFKLSDRRRAVQLELGREETIAFTRSLGETATTRTIESEILATRGERLALLRWRIEIAGGDVGSSELVQLNLFEVDAQGVRTAMVRWDEDQLDAAYAELDARFAELSNE
jgi:ketosteroid isomerase-like protein